MPQWNPEAKPCPQKRLRDNNVLNFNHQMTPICRFLNNTVGLKACLSSTVNSVDDTDLAGRQHQVNEFHCSAGCRPEISETRVLTLQ